MNEFLKVLEAAKENADADANGNGFAVAENGVRCIILAVRKPGSTAKVYRQKWRSAEGKRITKDVAQSLLK